MVKAKARGLRHKGQSAHFVWRNEGRAFLRCAVDVARNHLTVPVDEFRRVGVVVNVDNHALAFFKAQERTRKLAVVNVVETMWSGAEFDERGADAQTVVRLRGLRLHRQPVAGRGSCPSNGTSPAYLSNERRSMFTGRVPPRK